jgi:death on curing protein
VTPDWRWVSKQALILLHGESLAEHGGSAGMRDEGLLTSALARPQNLAAYGDPDIADLASCYAVGIAKNHPFVDGNKRAGFLALGLFLGLNGKRLAAAQRDATETMLAVAAGDLTETELARWVRDRLVGRE